MTRGLRDALRRQGDVISRLNEQVTIERAKSLISQAVAKNYEHQLLKIRDLERSRIVRALAKRGGRT